MNAFNDHTTTPHLCSDHRREKRNVHQDAFAVIVALVMTLGSLASLWSGVKPVFAAVTALITATAFVAGSVTVNKRMIRWEETMPTCPNCKHSEIQLCQVETPSTHQHAHTTPDNASESRSTPTPWSPAQSPESHSRESSHGQRESR